MNLPKIVILAVQISRDVNFRMRMVNVRMCVVAGGVVDPL